VAVKCSPTGPSAASREAVSLDGRGPAELLGFARPPGCDPCAARAGRPAVVVRPLWSVDSALGDDGDRLGARDGCVCGVHGRRALLPHSRRRRVIPSRSSETTGASQGQPVRVDRSEPRSGGLDCRRGGGASGASSNVGRVDEGA
jgi:hypothetical protein